MNAFDKCSLLAARSLRELEPFLRETQGRYVLTDKGRLSRVFQETFGDLIFNTQDGVMHTVELKADGTQYTNLWLEIWSNFNLADRASYAALGPNPGWLLKLNADLLFYHFVNQDRVVIMRLDALQRWAFCHPSKNLSEPDYSGERLRLSGRVFDFRQVKQSATQQRNTTVGAPVPLDVLMAEMDPKPKVRAVRQLRLDMFNEAA